MQLTAAPLLPMGDTFRDPRRMKARIVPNPTYIMFLLYARIKSGTARDEQQPIMK